MTGKTCIDAAIIQYLHSKNNTLQAQIAYFGNFSLLNEETIEKWQSEAEPVQIVFLSKMEYNETINILPRLRLRYGRNLI